MDLMDYSPILCGNCPFMVRTKPQANGYKAKCAVLDKPVRRCDFCQRPEEVSRHEAAKAVYEEVQNRKQFHPARFNIRPIEETGYDP